MKTQNFIAIILAMLCTPVMHSIEENTTNQFNNVLLIINFNWPHYQNINFFKEIYGKTFPNMVFYGEEKHLGVETIAHQQGYFAQRTLADAMRKWPNYTGYLWINDDCMINFWRLQAYDLSKVWRSGTGKANLNNLPNNWNWWHSPYGYTVLRPFYDNLPALYKDMLINNLGPQEVECGYGECFYFPAKYREHVISLCDRLTNVFIEIALPTLCACLCPLNDIVTFSSAWCNGNNYPEHYYTPTVDWVHPMKFSNINLQNFIRKQIALHNS